MARCERCNGCQSMLEKGNCEFCNYPSKDSRGLHERVLDDLRKWIADKEEEFWDDDKFIQFLEAVGSAIDESEERNKKQVQKDQERSK